MAQQLPAHHCQKGSVSCLKLGHGLPPEVGWAAWPRALGLSGGRPVSTRGRTHRLCPDCRRHAPYGRDVHTFVCKVTGKLVKNNVQSSAQTQTQIPAPAYLHVLLCLGQLAGGTDRDSVGCLVSHHTPLCPQLLTVARGAQRGSRPCLSLAHWSCLGNSLPGTHRGWAGMVGRPGHQVSR